jgi:hypothetical protein
VQVPWALQQCLCEQNKPEVKGKSEERSKFAMEVLGQQPQHPPAIAMSTMKFNVVVSQGLEMRRFGQELLEPNEGSRARAPRDHFAEAV